MDHVDQFDQPRLTAFAWYDFICPFCYVGQQRTRVLENAGIRVVEIPLQAHPEIPPDGVAAGARLGPMYELIAREAAAAGLPLNWPSRIPNSRLALCAAEWARRNESAKAAALRSGLFAAHFVNGEDLGDPGVIDRHLADQGMQPLSFWNAVNDGSADRAVTYAQALARFHHVAGTPAWVVGDVLIEGLRPAATFEDLALRQQQVA